MKLYIKAIGGRIMNTKRNDFILTSRDGFAHASDVSAYSLVAVSRIAKQKDLLNENAKY